MSTAERYDTFRHTVDKIVPPTVNHVLITRGVQAIGDNDGIQHVMAIVREVARFDQFTEDNDPYEEHDFGSFDYMEHKIFWKIDDHNGNDGINLLLTIMLAKEY